MSWARGRSCKLSTPLGQELRRLRKSRSLTLDEVAGQTGITKQYLSLIEKGQRKSVSFEIMNNISNFYNIPLDYFRIFIQDKPEQRALTEQELTIWQTINERLHEEIFIRDSQGLDTLMLFFSKK